MTARSVFAALWLAASAAAAQTPTADVNPQQQVLITVRNVPQAGMRPAGSTWRGYAFSGIYDASVSVARSITDIAEQYRLTVVDQWSITLLGEHCVVYRIPDGAVRDDLVRALKSDRRVALVQPLNLFEARSMTYDDALHDAQYSAAVLQLAEAHAIATGAGVRIALVDTGVSLSHPDLQEAIVGHRDFTDLPDTFETDRHGTALAGIMAAKANNAVGIVGVAPEATLLSYKACWPESPDQSTSVCNSFTLSRALGAAADAGADVINLSLSGPEDPLLVRMVAKIVERGTAVVGAVPEPDSGKPAFPSSSPGVIAVRSGGRPAPAHAPAAVPAPGVDILTTAPDAGYDFQSGSSMATAHVSGIVALLKQLRPDAGEAELRGWLRLSPVAASGGSSLPDDSLNACESLAAALNRRDACGR